MEALTLKESLPLLADKICDFAARYSRQVRPSVAGSTEDLQSAYSLVYQEYNTRGYCLWNPSRMHYNFYCALPASRTFLLNQADPGTGLLGTATLIPDSPCGLPLEVLFPSEVQRFRLHSEKLAEIGLLALEYRAFGYRKFCLNEFQKLTSLFRLFKYVFDYASHQGIGTFLIAVHPKHERLYRFLGFDSIGPVRSHSGACGKPAILMRLRLEQVRVMRSEKGFAGYFSRDWTPRQNYGKSFLWDQESLREWLVERNLIWNRMTAEQKTRFSKSYPALRLEESFPA